MSECDHVWEQGWQKSGPSYRWSAEMQWPDDWPARHCKRCGAVERFDPMPPDCGRECPCFERGRSYEAEFWRE